MNAKENDEQREKIMYEEGCTKRKNDVRRGETMNEEEKCRTKRRNDE